MCVLESKIKRKEIMTGKREREQEASFLIDQILSKFSDDDLAGLTRSQNKKTDSGSQNEARERENRERLAGPTESRDSQFRRFDRLRSCHFFSHI